ncbi:MAG: histidine kinase [Fulvivirga sp.]|uniref:sensor histidine kinase n=1 Tax=Fulvivirga sp. TaxID=1931237 RepID=UPI0032ECC5B8
MSIFERIPKIYKTAYLFICGWYAVNYLLSSLIEWQVFRPYNTSVLWNGLYMFEALCIFIALIFFYCEWLFRRNVVFQITGHTAGLFVFFMSMSYISYYFDFYLDGLVFFDDWKDYMLNLLSWDAMRFYDQYIITVAVFYIIRYFEHVQRKEQEKSQLALKNKEMQLALLKSQINPHFLFNTLNSISTLISSSKEKARKVITQLSDVFRYALDSHSGVMVKLADELDFIENYIRIQQVRFGDRLQYETDIDGRCLGMDVPPMILQPLVENSVKYGIAPKDEGGTIRVHIKKIAHGVYFEVSDNGLGVNASKVLDGKSTGVGLKNSDRRLKSIFGRSAGLKIEPRKDGYTVKFTIPIENVYKSDNQESELIEH